MNPPVGLCVCWPIERCVVSVSDLDGNDLLSYWPALEGCETQSLQKWGSERRLGADYSKDAANNNQADAALTSGDENGPTPMHRHRKGEKHLNTNTRVLSKVSTQEVFTTLFDNLHIHVPL